MANFLAAARDAVWRSIREYDKLRGDGVQDSIFRSAYLWNKDQAEMRFDVNLPPPVELMPAISIRTGPGGNEQWETETNKVLEQFVEITLWTRFHNQQEGERLWQLVWESIQQVPSIARPYLKDVIGVRPIRAQFPTITFAKTQFEFRRMEDGSIEETVGNPCTETVFAIVADHRKDPRSAYN